MGGCVYILDTGGTMDIAGATCAAKPMIIEIPGCKVEIGPQEGLGTVSYTNLNVGEGPKQEVTASFNLEGVKYTASGGSCPEAGVKTNGLYTTGRTILTAEEPGTEAMVGMSVG